MLAEPRGISLRKFVSALYVATLCATMITPISAADFTAIDLAREEGKFAASSVENGMRAAFLEFFADQSWLLRPEPVDAKTWLRGRPDPAIILDWKSQRTMVSSSGDFGFSTGPWILRSKDDPKAPAAHGQFFSVWQKQKNGDWKVLVDHGISHGPTTTPNALPTTPLIALDLVAQKPGTPVYDAEKEFLDRTSKLGPQQAYVDSVTSQTVLLRDGQFPITGKVAVMAHIDAQAGEWSWTPGLKGTSNANDFAYSVGSYTGKTLKGETRKGQYVRVWIRDANGEAPTRWTLAAEIITPAPPPKS